MVTVYSMDCEAKLSHWAVTPTEIVLQQTKHLMGQDDDPYLPGVGRSKPLSLEMATLEQFLPLSLEITPALTYCPHARPFMQ